MMMIKITKTIFSLALLVLLAVSNAPAQGRPHIPDIDRIRLAEAFRIGETMGNRVWQDWIKRLLRCCS